MININFKFNNYNESNVFSLIGRRTYEGLDEEPMLVDDDGDEEYDNNQFTGYDNTSKTPQGISKRMKQSPIGKKWVIMDMFSYSNQAIEFKGKMESVVSSIFFFLL